MSHNETHEEKDNVVQMPIRNMKKQLYREHLSQKRLAYLGSFVAFLALFGFVNHMVMNTNESGVTGRGIASAGSHMQRSYDKEFEAQMLGILKEAQNINMGRKPNSLDQFKYGELQGHYRLKLKKGKIRSIELSEAISRIDAKYKKSPLDFLLTHSKHLPVEYTRVDKLNSEVVDGALKESYTLKKGSKEVGVVHFEHNQDGGLVSFVVE
jgi:hypothetical protein